MKATSTLFVALLTALPAVAQPNPALHANLPRLDAAIASLVKESGVPGASVAVVHEGKVIYMKGFGVRQVGRPEVVDADTVFQLASCSKPMTSTAVASLASKRILNWDDPVAKFLPDFRLQDDWVSQHATIRDMLSHRSGLPGFAGDVLESIGLDRLGILGRLRFLKPAYPFRSGYAYTNFGYTTGGEAAARAAGLSFEDMMQREVFGPLGMTSSSARFRDFASHANHAHTHTLAQGRAVPTERNPDPQAPAGGVSTSARDMIRWAQFHLDEGQYQGKQLISREALGQTYQIHAVTRNNPGDFSSKGYYGLGWAISYDPKGRYKVAHSGAFSIGARTSVTLLPQEKLGIVVLANAFPSGLPEGISAGVINLYDTGNIDTDLMTRTDKMVGAAMSGLVASDVKPLTGPRSPAQSLQAYAGDFHDDFLGDARVSVRGPRLVLQVGNQQFTLDHETRDTFLARSADPNADPFRVNFVFDGATVQGFRQEGLEPTDSPYFNRKPDISAPPPPASRGQLPSPQGRPCAASSITPSMAVR